MKKQIKEVQIQKEISRGRQGISYKEILKIGDNKIMIFIESDSYDFQCKARVSVFKELKWELVATIHYSQMNTEAKLCYLPNDRGEQESNFIKDRNELLKLANAIIN